jgi:hypothetical protein
LLEDTGLQSRPTTDGSIEIPTTDVVEVGTGPMKEHSWLEFEVSRVLNLAQNAPCFLLKAEKLVCCAIKSIFIAARCRFYQNNH